MELPGNVEPGLAVGWNRDGRLELFGVNATNGTAGHCRQMAPNGVNTRPPWSSWGGLMALPGLATGQHTNGSLTVFGVSTAGAIVCASQVRATGETEWSAKFCWFCIS
jgi:hypothetical protein